ncbi:High mobility group protein 20A [Halotydeus destructor]|nr:High mobility group protein 20A [Halotydeus destructor]
MSQKAAAGDVVKEAAQSKKTEETLGAAAGVGVTEKKKPAQKRRASSEVKDAKEGQKSAKKKKTKDANAPRPALNGYVLFLNKNRPRIRETNPEMHFADITKLLAIEWNALSTDEKQRYLEEAEKDKERYQRELDEYKVSDAYKDFQIKQQDKEAKTQEKMEAKSKKETEAAPKSSTDIPIFTEEFLEHNRARESELRQLRKWNTEFEEQNAILSKHIDNMKDAIEKLEVESTQHQMNNQILNQYLTQLRSMLVKSFSGFLLPGSTETPNMDNIDKYMAKLHAVVMKPEKSNNKENEFAERVRKVAAQINLDNVKN